MVCSICELEAVESVLGPESLCQQLSKPSYPAPGSLSLLSLGLQTLVMALVSVRWFARLGSPHYDAGDVDKMPFVVRLLETLPILYAWGMLAINYAACAVGYALLICCYALGRHGEGVVLDEERSRLLG